MSDIGLAGLAAQIAADAGLDHGRIAHPARVREPTGASNGRWPGSGPSGVTANPGPAVPNHVEPTRLPDRQVPGRVRAALRTAIARTGCTDNTVVY
ncbi:hypothetical protein Kisp02_52240 [Kineosporia sp. NBRC 101731]|nr:hypothetical protein Kisp02_52240 [Kineosporia sp. NBRC 101731]